MRLFPEMREDSYPFKTFASVARFRITDRFYKYESNVGILVVGDSKDGKGLMVKFKRHNSKNWEWLRIGPTKVGLSVIHKRGKKVEFWPSSIEHILLDMMRRFYGGTRINRNRTIADATYNVHNKVREYVWTDVGSVWELVFGGPMQCGSMMDSFLRMKYPKMSIGSLDILRRSRRLRRIIHSDTDYDSVVQKATKGKKVLKKELYGSDGIFKIDACEFFMRSRKVGKDWNIGQVVNYLQRVPNMDMDFEMVWDLLISHYNPKQVISRFTDPDVSEYAMQMTIKDTVYMLDDIQRRGIPYQLPDRLPRIQVLHDQMIAIVNNYNDIEDVKEMDNERRIHLGTGEYAELNGVEVDGHTIFIPDTYGDILDIGVALHNCVGSYREHVKKGKTFIVALKDGDQFTHCIELNPGPNAFTLGQFSGDFNASVKLPFRRKFVEVLNDYIPVEDPREIRIAMQDE